ncbi:MAG: DUF853 domain-containing protein [Lachnospiraceae bacterium]|nr:DUF853 domain-containing protein [Lachnospiraceae bacterium]
MLNDGKILIGKSGDENIYIYPQMANRHGMICGATGTGKTVTLKVMAESFSKMGVPVFLADVKGDLAAMCNKGTNNENVSKRVESMGLNELGFDFEAFPSNFWDVYGEKGMPLRTTVSEMGPILLSRILDLNDTQTDVLTVLFKIADDEGLLLFDIKDLKSMITYANEKRVEYAPTYGNLAPQSLAAIQRAIVALEADGADKFFGEPALSVYDWLQTNSEGKGVIQILDCQKLILHPRTYSTFLLWLMSELFEALPELGDVQKPKMVFFFDEAHMLFDNAPKALLEKIEQVVKLIRSKGVGIYFITQNPKDIPDGVLAQLGNKVEHALRAYTPAEQKSARAAATAFRENPEFDTYTVLQELGTGQALVSVLGEDGIPTIVKKTKILPPQSQMGTLDDYDREREIKSCLLFSKYSQEIDSYSAYEFLQRRQVELDKQAEKDAEAKEAAKAQEKADKEAAKEREKAEKAEAKKKDQKKKAVKNAAKSVASSTAGTIGREVGKSIGSVGGKFGKTVGGNLGSSLARNIIGTLFKL